MAHIKSMSDTAKKYIDIIMSDGKVRNAGQILDELYKSKNPRLYIRLAEGKMVNFSTGKEMCYQNTADLEARHIIRYEEAIGTKPIANSKIG